MWGKEKRWHEAWGKVLTSDRNQELMSAWGNGLCDTSQYACFESPEVAYSVDDVFGLQHPNVGYWTLVQAQEMGLWFQISLNSL